MKGQGHKTADDQTESVIPGMTGDPCRNCAGKTAVSWEAPEDLFRMIIENAGNSIVVTDLNLNIIYCSPSIIHLSGYTAEEIRRFSFRDMFTPESLKIINETYLHDLEQLKKSGGDEKIQHYMQVQAYHKLGHTVWLEITVTYITDTTGKITGFIGVIKDYEKTKKDVDNLIEREKNYSELLDNSPNALVIINLDDQSIVYANKYFCEQVRVPHREITRFKAGDFIADKFHANKLLKELTSSYHIRNEEVLLKDKKGKQFWAEVSGGLVNFRKMDTACCTLKNITLKKKIETELKESEERFRNISESISDLSYSCSPNASGVYQLNWIFGPTEKITGYSNKELFALKCWGNLVIPEDSALFRKKIIQTKAGKNNSCQLRIRHKKGHLVWIMASARLVVHSVSGKYCLYGGIIDITEKKKAELSLAESEHLYRILTNHLPLIIDRYDRDLKHVFVNSAMMKYTDMKPEEFIGKKNVDINAGREKYIDFNRSLTNVFKTGKQHELEWVFVTPHKGERIFFYTRMIPEFDENGRVNYVLCMTEDISERKRLDAMIARASVESEEKMRTAFASDLHDGLGPLLSSIKILNKTLEYDTSEQGFRSISDKINHAVDYSIGTIRELSHNMNPRILVNHGLNKALEYFLQSFRPDGLHVSYSNSFRDRMDVSIETAVFRVVTELFGNTLKHSGATEVKISIRKIKECCKIHYSDNGCGFNTGATLSEYRGNGLFNIVNRMKAINAIHEFKSKEGKGFSFNAQFKT